MRLNLSEPESISELLARAQGLAGRTLGEVGRYFEVEVPETQHRAKGMAGKIAELALGASAGNKAAPDFEKLGVELKTVPMTLEGKVQESMFVCSIPLMEIADMDWKESPVHKKLKKVLLVPVEKPPKSEKQKPLYERRFGIPFLWELSAEEEMLLKEDWAELVGLIGAGRVEQVTGHLGQVLQVRPKAANSKALRDGLDEDESRFLTLPRGFYLRAKFVQWVFDHRSIASKNCSDYRLAKASACSRRSSPQKSSCRMGS